LTFCYKPAAQSVRQTGSNAQCRLGATHRERRETGISPEGTRTPVVLGDSPRRQGCLVTRIEPSSASTPRAHNTQQPHAKGRGACGCFCIYVITTPSYFILNT